MADNPVVLQQEPDASLGLNGDPVKNGNALGGQAEGVSVKETVDTSSLPNESEAEQDSLKQKPEGEKTERKPKDYFTADTAARTLLPKLRRFVAKHKGKYRKGSDGQIYLVLDERRICLQPERNDPAQRWLLMETCRVTARSPAAQSAIDMLAHTGEKTAKKLNFRSFSSLPRNRDRIYVPIGNRDLLKITATEATPVPNGENDDDVWVDHPSVSVEDPEKALMDGPFRYIPGLDSQVDCEIFEQLLVKTQSVVVESLSWLVAMHEAFFPFIREYCERTVVVGHLGRFQSGKSTAAERFTRLLGLGKLKLGWSVASLDNSPDQGLLVLDNLERRNLTPEHADAIIRRTTGGTKGRSNSDGSRVSSKSNIEASVITTAQGLPLDELKERWVPVQFYLPEGGQIDNAKNEFAEITDKRDTIFSSVIVPVLQLWLRDVKLPRRRFWNGQGPKPNFSDHMMTLAELLVCFGKVCGKPDDWALGIIKDWEPALQEAKVEDAGEHPWEYAISSILKGVKAVKEDGLELESNLEIRCHGGRLDKGRKFTLYTMRTAALHSKLAERHDIANLPDNSSWFGRELSQAEGKFKSFVLLKQDDPDFPEMKKKSGFNKVGFLVPVEEGEVPMKAA
jgi:hypothetical protein